VCCPSNVGPAVCRKLKVDRRTVFVRTSASGIVKLIELSGMSAIDSPRLAGIEEGVEQSSRVHFQLGW
jgi:hypothetical protein